MIITVLIAAVSFFIGAQLLSGVKVTSFWQAILVAIVVALLDLTLGNLLRVATLGLLTLGLFSWLLSALLIRVAAHFLSGFEVRSFWWALWLAGIVSLVSRLIESVLQ